MVSWKNFAVNVHNFVNNTLFLGIKCKKKAYAEVQGLGAFCFTDYATEIPKQLRLKSVNWIDSKKGLLSY